MKRPESMREGLFDALNRKREKKPEPLCECGHDAALHDKQGCSYGRGNVHGGCPCTKLKKKRLAGEAKPTLDMPAGGFELVRPDTVRRKTMGWAVKDAVSATVWLDQLKTMSPNTERNMLMSAAFGRGGKFVAMAISTGHKTMRERGLSAMEQLKVLERVPHLPHRIIVTRIVSGPGLDGIDNLRGSLKRVVDGIAEGLLFNDKLFDTPGAPVLEYAQRSPGKRGVFGVMIELKWAPLSLGT